MASKTYEILDHPEVLRVMFYPRRAVDRGARTPGMHTIRIAVAEKTAIGGCVFEAAPDAPMIVLFHGNGEIAADYEGLAPLYRQLGLSLTVLDYRGYGISDGSPTATAMLADAQACFDQLPEVFERLGLSPRQLFLMGRSLGSAPAIDVAEAVGNRITGLIIESGFADTYALIERIGFLAIREGSDAENGFGNAHKIGRVTVPTLIIHGERDLIIPVSDAVALFNAAGAKDKRLIRIAEAGHNDLMLIGQDEYFGAIDEFCGVVAGRRGA